VARAKRDGEYKYLNVSLPVDLLKRLDDYYDKSRFNKNTIVEFALDEYLDKMQSELVSKHRG
jgi:ribbon-helix-helix protein, copG family